VDDDRAQGRCESHEQGTKYRDLARHHLAPYCASRTITARVPSTALGRMTLPGAKRPPAEDGADNKRRF
jgi:hypothetical protein